MPDRTRAATISMAFVLVVAGCGGDRLPSPSHVASPSPVPSLAPSPLGATASPALSTLPPSPAPSPPPLSAELPAFTWHSVRLSPTTAARFWSMQAVAARDGRLVAAALGPWVDYLPAVVSATLAP
jgi:hypothetical protein